MCCPRRSVRAVAIRHQRKDGVPNGASREATSTEEVANFDSRSRVRTGRVETVVPLPWDQGFESGLLQRGVCCEPAPLHQGARPANRSEVTGDRQAALQPDQRKVDSEAPCVRSAGPRPRDDPTARALYFSGNPRRARACATSKKRGTAASLKADVFSLIQ